MLPIAIGTPEIAIIGAIIVVLFGVKKLPELGKNLAQGIHEFKKASREIKAEDAKPAAEETKESS